MHVTKIVLKNGEEHSGILQMFRPKESYMSILEYDDKDVGTIQKYDFHDIKSAVTIGERIDIRTIGDQDEVQRARNDLVEGRKNKWEGYPKKKFNWE